MTYLWHLDQSGLVYLAIEPFQNRVYYIQNPFMNGQALNFLKLNSRWLTAGIILLILGYIILGWNSTGSKSFEAGVFAWHKLILAPVVLLLGYSMIGVSIMFPLKK
jgi:hypothetical protein